MNPAPRSRSRRPPSRRANAGAAPAGGTRSGAARSGGSRSRSRTPLVIGIVAAAVVVIALVAVVLTRGDDDGDVATAPGAADGAASGGTASAGGADGTTPAAGATVDPLAAVIEVTGDPVPPGEGPDDAGVGSPAPALRGTDYTGRPVEVRPGEQGPTMVVFLAHWCPHCNEEIPVLLEWRDSGAIPDDLDIVGVSSGVAPDRPNYPPDEWLVERGWAWPVVADDATGAAARAYGVTGFPFFAVVGEDGTIRARNSGELPVEALDALVATVLNS